MGECRIEPLSSAMVELGQKTLSDPHTPEVMSLAQSRALRLGHILVDQHVHMQVTILSQGEVYDVTRGGYAKGYDECIWGAYLFPKTVFKPYL